MDGLTALDIVVLLALAFGLITGALRGFVQESLSLAALIVALFALRVLHEPVSMWLMELIGTEGGASMLAFALILGIIWGGGKYVAARIGASTRNSFIGPFDRVLGAGFGVLKSLLIVTALFVAATLASDVMFGGESQRPEWMTQSRTYPLLRATAAALSDVVAERMADNPAGADSPAGSSAP